MIPLPTSPEDHLADPGGGSMDKAFQDVVRGIFGTLFGGKGG